MCVLILYTAFVWNISHSMKKSARYQKFMCGVRYLYWSLCAVCVIYIGLYVRCALFVLVFMCGVRYSCHILVKLEFPRQIFRNIYIKFRVNPSSGSRVVCGWTDRQTDRHDETTSSFSKFCQRA
jgi:hypothetical protein